MKKESSIANMIALAIERVREKLAYCPVFPNTHSSAYFTHKKIGNDVQKFTPGSPKDAHDFDPVRKKIVKDAQNFRPKSPRHRLKKDAQNFRPRCPRQKHFL